MSENAPARKRDAEATKKAILNAATAVFAERGYDRTTIRDIAARAGANQALLFRYFGSKEELFSKITSNDAEEVLASSIPETLLDTALRSMFSEQPAEKGTLGTEALLRSIGNDNAAVALRAQVGDKYVNIFSTLTEHDNAELRAQLIAGWLLGIRLLQKMVKIEPLASADPDEICALVADAARTILEDIA